MVQYINIKHPNQRVTFSDAIVKGLGRDRGLFFPDAIPVIEDVAGLLELSFVDRSVEILKHFVDDSFRPEILKECIRSAFNFPLDVVPVEGDVFALELFHGPSLAFKDFGARFLAECLNRLNKGSTTILTATSGDTGAAVAHAFLNQPGIRVVILYPQGRISQFQEKLFCTLGGNIEAVAVKADFDACQAMVKMAFEDADVVSGMQLNSANSINVGRLLAQICYYFEAVAQLPPGDPMVCSVPSGNFGNLTAGLIARQMGLGISRFVAGTNRNDTVPRYLESGVWEPHPTKATDTNAMDISKPNNFPRIEWLFKDQPEHLRSAVQSFSIDDTHTRQLVKDLYQRNYLAEPHTALAFGALKKALRDDERGVFLGTAHPVKFKEIIEEEVGRKVFIPAEFEEIMGRPLLSEVMEPDFNLLKQRLLSS